MKIISRILLQGVASPFYRRYAGLFLFLFFLLFGIQPSMFDALQLHYALMHSILNEPLFFGAVTAILVLYTLATILFIRSCLYRDAYDFLFLLNALPSWKRFVYLCHLQGALSAPAIVYSLIVCGTGIRENQAVNGILFLLTAGSLSLLAVVASWLFLQRAKGLRQVISSRFSLPVRPGLALFLLKFVFRQQPGRLLLIKLVSFGGLYLFTALDAAVFENRMLWLIFITLLTGHSMIVYRNFWFIENELVFYRNMPVTNIYTLCSLLVVYFLLLLPEAWALRGLWINHGYRADYCWMVLTGPLFLLLVHVLLYTEDMEVSEWLKLLFGIWLVFTLFSLSRHHWLMPGLSLFFSILLFRITYRRYEKNAAVEKAG